MQDFVILNGVHFSNMNVKAKFSWLQTLISINEYNLNIKLKDEIWAVFLRVYTILLTGIIYVFIPFPTL